MVMHFDETDNNNSLNDRFRSDTYGSHYTGAIPSSKAYYNRINHRGQSILCCGDAFLVIIPQTLGKIGPLVPRVFFFNLFESRKNIWHPNEPFITITIFSNDFVVILFGREEVSATSM
eukprot:scaffold437_cov111-Cylindrotheca_fusiformis.AAC.2